MKLQLGRFLWWLGDLVGDAGLYLEEWAVGLGVADDHKPPAGTCVGCGRPLAELADANHSPPEVP